LGSPCTKFKSNILNFLLFSRALSLKSSHQNGEWSLHKTENNNIFQKNPSTKFLTSHSAILILNKGETLGRRGFPADVEKIEIVLFSKGFLTRLVPIVYFVHKPLSKLIKWLQTFTKRVFEVRSRLKIAGIQPGT